MNLLKSLLGRKEPIRSYEDFWKWFQLNSSTFFKVVKGNGNIEKDFFEKLSPKLNQLNEGFYFVTGMYDENTAELIFTADGAIRNIVFVEELVASAPKIDFWKFTALKPALDIKDVNISMAGYKFNQENISFYANDQTEYPDEIDITIVYNDFDEDNKNTIINGTYIFLDNLLGELNFATTIDSLNVIGKNEAKKELLPIEKLKTYLTWREKEFVEKYEGARYNTENDSYAAFEATLQNGNALVAIINTDLLDWESKASHPWILTIELKYDGEKTNGMPDEATYKLLGEIEQDILNELKDQDGYLNIGRQTADSTREIYMACKDFRKPSKVLRNFEQQYSNRFDFSYDIYKDKYWRTFNQFTNRE